MTTKLIVGNAEEMEQYDFVNSTSNNPDTNIVAH